MILSPSLMLTVILPSVNDLLEVSSPISTSKSPDIAVPSDSLPVTVISKLSSVEGVSPVTSFEIVTDPPTVSLLNTTSFVKTSSEATPLLNVL